MNLVNLVNDKEIPKETLRRVGFEPTNLLGMDLQSTAFSHFATFPYIFTIYYLLFTTYILPLFLSFLLPRYLQ